MSVTHTKLGGRRIELYIPFEYNGENVDAISFGPWKLDYTLDWQAGKFTSFIGVMAMLAKVDEKLIREVCEPDAARVIGAFIEMVPPEMREDIASGQMPRSGEEVASASPIPDLDQFEASNSGETPRADDDEDGTAGSGFGLDDIKPANAA
jgi:hypothetical protein